VQVGSTLQLARALVEQALVVGLILERRQVDAPLLAFLRMLKESFALLPVSVVSPPLSPGEELPQGYQHVDCSLSPARVLEELRRFAASLAWSDRRRKPRFDWPLQGYLSFDKKQWQRHNLWAISSSGAFLECRQPVPSPGTAAYLRIVFQNSKLITACELLDQRRASSRLPPGFAVRFTLLSEDSLSLLDRIVQNALVQALMEPDSDPEVPSLDEEDLLIPGFEPGEPS
jgi:hypothetical protein